MSDLGYHDPSLPPSLNANSPAFNPSQWAHNNSILKPIMPKKGPGAQAMKGATVQGDKTFTKLAAPVEWNELIGLFQSGALNGFGGPAEFFQSPHCDQKWLQFKKSSFANGWTQCKKEATVNTNGPAAPTGKVSPVTLGKSLVTCCARTGSIG